MAYNLIRFERGKIEAYNALRDANRLDENTLYFIYSDDNTTGSLYMGSRYISGGDVTIESGSLEKLTDVILTSVQANDFLVYNGEKWENKTVEQVAALILGDKLDTLSSKITAMETKVGNLETGLNSLSATVGLKAVDGTPATGLFAELDKKVDKVTDEDGKAWTLLSPTDKAKLDKLTIDSDGDLAISGTVNAANVEGLGDWIKTNGANNLAITENLQVVDGKLDLADNVKSKINFITSVDEANFSVVNGKLNLSQNIITTLQKVESGDLNQFIKSVDETYFNVDGTSKLGLNLTAVIGDMSILSEVKDDGVGTVAEELAYIYDVLTWKDIDGSISE